MSRSSAGAFTISVLRVMIAEVRPLRAVSLATLGWRIISTSPSGVPSGTFISIDAGEDHTCGLRTDGTITCWGINDRGQTNAPGGVSTSVVATSRLSCGWRPDGTHQCWGENRNNYAVTRPPDTMGRLRSHLPPGRQLMRRPIRRHRDLLGPLRTRQRTSQHVHNHHREPPRVYRRAFYLTPASCAGACC